MSSELERIATLEATVTGLAKELSHAEAAIEELRSDRKSLLVWGVLALGAVVSGLGAYIWSIKFG